MGPARFDRLAKDLAARQLSRRAALGGGAARVAAIGSALGGGGEMLGRASGRPRGAVSDEADPVVSVPVRVSGPSPFRDGCEGAPLRSRVYRGSVVEPMLAVDPRDPAHLVAIWKQDRIATSSASGVLTAVSRDGGRTWTTSAPAFTRCTGGTAANGGDYPRATDPWLTIGPDGAVYALVLAVNPFVGSETVSAMLVSRSADGGLTWGDPTVLAHTPIADGFNDKGVITADPFAAGVVYAVWDRDFAPDQTESGLVEAPAMFARATDGGRTWEPPRVVYAAPGARTIGHVLVVLPDGDLVDVFARDFPTETGDVARDIALIRSSDRGETWSEPVSASEIVAAPLRDPFSTYPIQPDAGVAVLPTVAVDPASGRLHVAWQDGRFSGGARTDIAYATSDDGGRGWSTPIKVNQTSGDVPAFVPTAAVMDDGTVGVSYYDLRNATPMRPTILADHWLVSCRGHCARDGVWRETHVAGPFDLEQAPYAKGFFLGDYQGLVGAASGFLVLYTVTNPTGSNSDFAMVTVR